ncbi:MAG: hypothetical protein U9P14_00970 [Gemmatimonadota bacterium]|nr:hypothetical protein [Gemmatimonadota bacterium]
MSASANILRLAVLWAAAAAALALLGLVTWGLWYRAGDHTEKLLSERRPLAQAEEHLLADSAGYRNFSFRLTDKLGRVTTGSLRVPDCIKGRKKPLPAILVLGGHGTGARAAGLIRLKQEAVICAMDYPPYPEGKITLLDLPGLIRKIDRAQAAVLEAVGMAFSALDYLCARSEVDTGRVTVLGASFGAPFAVITALDPRVRGLVLIHGAGDLEQVIGWNLRGRIKSGFLRKAASLILGTLTAPFEPAAYIGRVGPRPVLMINSTGDEKIPEPCVKKLFFNASDPKELIWLESSHIHPSNRALIDSVTNTVSAWLEEKDLL